MEISEYIDLCLKDYIDGEIDFKEACENISLHKHIKLIKYDKFCAYFKLKTETFSSRIIINNDNLKAKHDPEYVLQKVSIASGISIEALKSELSLRPICEPRQAYFLINLEFKEESGLTLQEIADVVNRDHATVLHAKKVAHLNSIKRIIEKTYSLL